MHRAKYSILISLCAACAAPVAWAVPTTVTSQDIVGSCDTLVVPTNVDELGVAFFPPNETILASDQIATTLACPMQANPATVATQVSITNLTGRSFTDLWYVADPETTFTNVDGQVNGEHAFKIDTTGFNMPLIFESGIANGIFEPGETWDFLIDDYFNSFGLPASALETIGVGIFSVADQKSSGSIIAIPVPEPATGLLVLSVAACVLGRRNCLVSR